MVATMNRHKVKRTRFTVELETTGDDGRFLADSKWLLRIALAIGICVTVLMFIVAMTFFGELKWLPIALAIAGILVTVLMGIVAMWR
jgi:uncharacterized membrane protein